MNRIKWYEVIGLVFMLALTVFAGVSCAKANQDISGVTWVLKSYGDPAGLTPVIADKETTALFDKQNMRVSGNGGVNGYGGEYKVNGNNLTVTGIISTLMASTNEALNMQENAFFKIMQSAKTFTIDGTQLTITGTEGTLVFSKQ